jgi:hypothetical protein
MNPLDAGLLEIGARLFSLPFPPPGWRILQPWGLGFALDNYSGLRVIVDCAMKEDGNWWVHVSASRKTYAPSHADMQTVKRAFLGDRYAYAVWPPEDKYVNIHANCLHLWSRIDHVNGRVLPEFSEVLPGIGKTI